MDTFIEKNVVNIQYEVIEQREQSAEKKVFALATPTAELEATKNTFAVQETMAAMQGLTVRSSKQTAIDEVDETTSISVKSRS